MTVGGQAKASAYSPRASGTCVDGIPPARRTVMGLNTWCRSLLRLSYTTAGGRGMVIVDLTPVKYPSAEYGSVYALGGGGCGQRE